MSLGFQSYLPVKVIAFDMGSYSFGETKKKQITSANKQENASRKTKAGLGDHT